MAGFPILSMLLALPLVGALAVLLFCRNGSQIVHEHAHHDHHANTSIAGLPAKILALAVSTVTFLVSLLLLNNFNMHGNTSTK